MQLNRGSSDALQSVISIRKSRGTNAAPTIVSSGDTIGDLQFYAYDGASYIQAAQISASVGGTPGTNDMPGRLVFATTADGASSPTERMRIGSDGGVSIGTTAAAGACVIRVLNTLLATDRLEINSHGTGNRYAYIDLVGDDTYTDFGFRLIRNNTGPNATTNLTSRGTGGTLMETIEDAPLMFSTFSTERLRIDSSGNVLVKSAAGLGYGTGAGGQVTQTGSRTTGVTLSKPTGAITIVSAAGSTSWQSFTVTNTVVAAEDVVVVSQKSGADLYEAHVTNVAAGSFRISFRTTGGTTTEQPVFSFAVIKGAIA